MVGAYQSAGFGERDCGLETNRRINQLVVWNRRCKTSRAILDIYAIGDRCFLRTSGGEVCAASRLWRRIRWLPAR